MAQYRQLALEAIKGIQSRGKTPLFVGGSGMYMAVLLDGIFDKKIEDASSMTSFYNSRRDLDGSKIVCWRAGLGRIE